MATDIAARPASIGFDFDFDDLAAIVQLQLDDARELTANAKGKGREGSVSDADLALQVYAEGLQSHAAVLSDRRMAYSISIAVQDDGDILQHSIDQNQQIVTDHLIANRLQGRQDSCIDTTQFMKEMEQNVRTTDMEDADTWRDPEMLAKVNAIYNQPLASRISLESIPGTIAESSARASRRVDTGKAPVGRCIACGDEKDFFAVARVPCNHEYCRPCLEELFSLSLKDETLFPPRCDGQEIPLGRVRFFLPIQLATDFGARYAELSTKNRTYCHERTCSAFIPQDAIQHEIGTCPICSKTTCSICKSPSHTGDCPQDSALQELIETATAEQWQRCYSCNRFVELNTGCNHMTCPCGAHFCYVCGLKWKTCACEQWDENRLIARAEQLVNRNPRRQMFQPVHAAHAQPPTRATSPTPVSLSSSSGSSEAPALPVQPLNIAGLGDWREGFGTDELVAPILPAVTRLRPNTNGSTDRISAMMEHLRENHACDHDKWRWVRGSHECEECSWVSDQYIFECRQCQLQACNRCRRNRL